MSRRKTREAEVTHPPRENDDRADVWTPPAILDAPSPREGMVQRWVSTQILGEGIPHHTMRRFREGWTPRPLDTIPENFFVPTIEHGKYEGYVGVEGMILCEMSKERVESRRQYFAGKTSEQAQFVDKQLGKVSRAGGIPIDRQLDQSVSRGQRVAADD